MVRTANFSHEDEEIPFALQSERSYWPLEGEELPDLSLADLKRLRPDRRKSRESAGNPNQPRDCAKAGSSRPFSSR